MIYPVYAYRDNKTNFSQPYIEQNDAAAMRGFAYMINQQNSIMGYSPSDYDLFRIGDFNSATGEIVSVVPVQFLVNGSNVVGDKYEK